MQFTCKIFRAFSTILQKQFLFAWFIFRRLGFRLIIGGFRLWCENFRDCIFDYWIVKGWGVLVFLQNAFRFFQTVMEVLPITTSSMDSMDKIMISIDSTGKIMISIDKCMISMDKIVISSDTINDFYGFD